LKKLVVVLAMLQALLVHGQVLNYKSEDGDWSVNAGGGSLKFMGPNRYQFTLKKSGGNVYIRSARQGLELWSPSLVAIIDQTKGVKEPVQKVTAQQSLRILRKGSGDTSELTGSGGTFVGSRSSANVTISGPVRLVNSRAGKETLNVTGSSATAHLTNSAQSRPLQSATVSGNVRVSVTQATGGNISLRASKMTYGTVGGEGRITLTGNVKAEGGKSTSTFNLETSRATLYLNKDGAVYKFDFS
jgi:hypothetical protein